jgi:diguanylate cyclase (GGDEF)-like protein/PAS domain S-box-containing protein
MRSEVPAHLPVLAIGEAGEAYGDGMFREIVENAADVIVRGDAARRRTYVSPSSREMLGYEPAELLEGHGFSLVHPDDLRDVEQAFATLGPANPCLHLIFRMRRKDSAYIWVGGRYRHLADDGGVLCVLRDITAQKQAELQLAEVLAKLEAANEKLRDIAYIDGLTGLSNRRRFDERLEEEYRRAERWYQPLGLVLLDVDHFKGFNDRYGHLAGDDCLRRISRSVAAAVPRSGDCAARYGGEEIAVLLPATGLDGAMAVAERIRAAVAALGIAHEGSRFGIVTVSGGAVETWPSRPGGVPSDLIRAADAALYRAKAAGRNRVCLADHAPVTASARTAAP